MGCYRWVTTPNIKLSGTHSWAERDMHCESGVLPKNTTQCCRPGLEPRLLNQETSTKSMNKLRIALPVEIYINIVLAKKTFCPANCVINVVRYCLSVHSHCQAIVAFRGLTGNQSGGTFSAMCSCTCILETRFRFTFQVSLHATCWLFTLVRAFYQRLTSFVLLLR